MPDSSRLTLRGGRVLDPANGVDAQLDLHVADGRIIGLGAAPDNAPAQVIDISGKWLLPGLVDLAGQVGSPDSLARGELRAAAAGGITRLAVPPQCDAGLDNPAVVGRLRDGALALGLLRLAPVGALTAGLAGERLAELGLLRRAGCQLVSQGGQPISARVLRRALEYARGHDLTVVLDAEDPQLAVDGCVHEGEVAVVLGLTGIPVAAEVVALSRALALATTCDTRVHLHGLSSAAGVSLLRSAKAAGLPVTADVVIWNLHYTDQDIGAYDPAFHLRPPLREAGDRAALREALADGTLDAVCSDHRPHDGEAKRQPFARCLPGVAGFEALLPLTLQLVEAGVLPLERALAALTSGPAAVLGAGGTLAVGAPADLCVVDAEQTWQVGADTWHSAGRCTPVWGQSLRGRVTLTLLAGRPVYGMEESSRGR
ncbi:MAG: amidohydrolase family protein [Immundisolibacter sp.]|uniref:amidohydrolase family protein n=1 Tax=Immundisolibacter sp. TaxID=1934948 RepID=UPI003EE33132